jgi:hypothetical protein
MIKKYIVRLSIEERIILEEIVSKLKGTSEKIRRAQILLKADANGPNWPDQKIAEAFSCSRRSVEIIRERLVTDGFEAILSRRKREEPPRKKLLDGKQEAQLLAMRLGSPPKGYGSWSLRLLANQMVALEITESISHETIRRTLKKMV